MIDAPHLAPCFQGVLPAALATCSSAGAPALLDISQVHYLDKLHVAIARKFPHATFQNIRENPLASLELIHPLTRTEYRLKLRHQGTEISGPVFDALSARIAAVSTLTGTTGLFSLLGAEIFEVLEIQAVGTTWSEDQVPENMASELQILEQVSELINRATSLEAMLNQVLATLYRGFGFAHSMLLVPDDSGENLVALVAHGYDERNLGAEIPLGTGVIGTVARTRRPMNISIAAELRAARAHRKFQAQNSAVFEPERILPGLPEAASELALPLAIQDRLLGVLDFESTALCAFHPRHQTYLMLIANQLALAVDRFLREEQQHIEPTADLPAMLEDRPRASKRSFQFFTNDDCIFVDGEYLIRNIPAKILWKLLWAYRTEKRTQFSNRELRLDESLGLPALKDNLESRLILLKKRLAEKCPEIRLVSTARGRFTLEVNAELEMVER